MNETSQTTAPIRVAWLAGPTTVHRWAATLQPLAERLARRDVELMLCAPRSAYVEVLELAADVRRYRWPWRGLGRTRACETVAEQIAEFDADVLHALDAPLATMASGVAEESGVPWTVSCYGIRDRRFLPRRDAGLAVVLAGGEPVAAALDGRLRSKVPVRMIRPGLEAPGPARQLPEGERLVTILVDAMGGQRRVMETLLAAYAELLQREHPCAMFLMDTSRAERRLRRCARQLGIGAEVTFVDPQPETEYADIIQGADLFMAAPTGGVMCLHTLQAMAAGVPVLAWPDPAADFLRPGETFRQLATTDAASLTEMLTEILTEPARDHELAVGALGHVRQQHDPDAAADAIAALYRAILAEELDSDASVTADDHVTIEG